MLLTEIDEHAPFMGIFKGESGTGKTTAACTFPPPIKVWSLDDRMKSVAMYLKTHEHPRERIEIETFGLDDFQLFMSDYGNAAENYHPSTIFQPTGEKFQTFVLDGLTSLGSMILAYCMSVRGQKEKERKKGIIRLPEIDDFMGEANALEKILGHAREINKAAHFIMTAHVVVSKSFDITTKQYNESRSLLTGGSKIASKVPIYFDEIWHFEADTEYTEDGPRSAFKCRTQHAGRDFARTSLPIPAVMDWTDGLLWPKVKRFMPPQEIEEQTQETDTNGSS